MLSAAIGASVMLRGRRRRVHTLFMIFSTALAAWYLSTFFALVFAREPGAEAYESVSRRVNLACAVLLPVATAHFFRAFVAPNDRRATWFVRFALFSSMVLASLSLTPIYRHKAVGAFVLVYVSVLLALALAQLFAVRASYRSRHEAERLRYLALVGALAAVFTILDYLPYIGLDIPPVGTVLTLAFLYALSQSIVRFRLLDLYELAGRLGLLLVVSFALATVFLFLVEVAKGWFFLHSVVASMALLLLYDPVRQRLESRIAQFFFPDRYDLEKTLIDLRRRLAHTLEADAVPTVIVAGLESSRRATQVSLYLADPDALGFDLAGSFGAPVAQRLEHGAIRPLLDRIARDDSVTLENLERELEEMAESGESRELAMTRDIVHLLDSLKASVALSIRGERDLYGLLFVQDERMRDAYSPREVALLSGVASQAVTTLENSQVYRRMKDRDRLAALGEVAAGLAHEVRNPLGAIKASAQYLAESMATIASSARSAQSLSPSESDNEFLRIIIDEVDRLNGVVSSFLDYARPSKGDPTPTDVNLVVKKTLQLYATECEEGDVEQVLSLATDLPPARVDAEQLRQVLINLVQNALQAMSGPGKLSIATVQREWSETPGAALASWVEVRVSDTVPGIPQRVLANLFVPFVTTKEQGTGLGLAISQRIVTSAGGQIDVRSHSGVGTTFVVRLPVANDTGAIRILRSDAPHDGRPAPVLGLASAPHDHRRTDRNKDT